MNSSGVDARALDALLARIRRGSVGLYKEATRALAREAKTQVALGFRGSRDPYGTPWAPLALRDGKPLLDTGRLQNSFATEILPDGFRIGTNTRYARTHQYGATIVPKIAKMLRFGVGRGRARKWFFRKRVTIPARATLPTGGELGAVWTRAFADVARRIFRRALGPP